MPQPSALGELAKAHEQQPEGANKTTSDHMPLCFILCVLAIRVTTQKAERLQTLHCDDMARLILSVLAMAPEEGSTKKPRGTNKNLRSDDMPRASSFVYSP